MNIPIVVASAARVPPTRRAPRRPRALRVFSVKRRLAGAGAGGPGGPGGPDREFKAFWSLIAALAEGIGITSPPGAANSSKPLGYELSTPPPLRHPIVFDLIAGSPQKC